MAYGNKRTDKEIDAQLDLAAGWEDAGKSAVPGMTYEQGVAYALKWVIGDEESDPIENAPSDDDEDEDEDDE